MPTYSYKHTEHRECTKVEPIDVFQSIKDEPLATCPECGAPVKRIITSPVAFSMPGGTPKFHG